MLDWYLVLTPLLLLPIVGLFVFVGCALSHSGRPPVARPHVVNFRLHIPSSQVSQVGNVVFSFGANITQNAGGTPVPITRTPTVTAATATTYTIYEATATNTFLEWQNVNLSCAIAPTTIGVMPSIQRNSPSDSTVAGKTVITIEFTVTGGSGGSFTYSSSPSVTTG